MRTPEESPNMPYRELFCVYRNKCGGAAALGISGPTPPKCTKRADLELYILSNSNSSSR